MLLQKRTEAETLQQSSLEVDCVPARSFSI